MNVVIFCADSLRPDFLGCYGHPTTKTPNIDSIAKGGVLFQEARTQYISTIHSVTALLTGSNIETNPKEMLLYQLANRGYAVELYFDYYYFASGEGHRCPADHRQDEIKRWLYEQRERPFFAFLWYHQTHTPYGSFDHYGPGINRQSADLVIMELIREGNIAEVERRYIEAVEEFDRQVGEITARVRSLGLAENTLIVLCSDHSEHWGDSPRDIKELDFHRNSRERNVTRVVLIMSKPDDLPAGKKVATQVRLIDVYPTIITLLNINLPQFVGHSWIMGRDLASVINGEETENRLAPSSILSGPSNSVTTTERLEDLGYI